MNSGIDSLNLTSDYRVLRNLRILPENWWKVFAEEIFFKISFVRDVWAGARTTAKTLSSKQRWLYLR